MDSFGWLFELDQFIKIALAICLGALIGVEREYHGRPAGLRTHILVTLGATILIIGSRSLPAIVNDIGFKGSFVIDPSRLAAGIITGIGFLGAGVVIKTEEFIRGVTTAACIWFSASIGIIIGMDMYLLAVGSTVIALFILIFMSQISHNIYPHAYRKITIKTKLEHPKEFTATCKAIIREHNAKILDIDYDRDNRKGEMTLNFFIRSRHREIGSSLTHVFGNLPNVIETSIH